MVVLMTDKRPQSQTSHFQHTGPLWTDRTRCVGPGEMEGGVV